MLSIKKILAPTDLSELSRCGVRLALEIARSQDAEVTVFHVVGQEEVARNYRVTHYEPTRSSELLVPEVVEERKRLLAAFLRENFADLLPHVKINFEVEVGPPYRKIIDRATEDRADLIVMSTHGKTGLLYALIGGVTEKVVRLAACPVLSVRPEKGSQQSTIPAA